MLSKLVTGLLVLTIASTATVEVESPKVGKNNFSKHPWGIYDFT